MFELLDMMIAIRGTLHLLLGGEGRRQWVMSMRILESQELQRTAHLLFRCN